MHIQRTSAPRPIWARAMLCIVSIFATTPAHAQTQGNIDRGRILGETSCSVCHAVSAGSRPTGIGSVPTFQAIAQQPSTTSMALRVFLQTPHAQMPNLVLNTGETDDIVAYILSLKH